VSKQCTESAQKSAQFFQIWQLLYQHIFIFINAKVDENQKVERFASMIILKRLHAPHHFKKR